MNTRKKVIVIMTMLAFIVSVTVFAAENSIDWSNGTLRAVGMAAGKSGETRVNLARAQARRAARMDALRNLAEQMGGVRVTSESSMKDLALVYDDVRTGMEAIIKNMQEAGEPTFYDDGVCELVLEVPLWGANSSVAEVAFLPFKDEVKVAFPQPSTISTGENTAVAGATINDKPYTGVVIDCSGMVLHSVMSPVIKNDKGQSIYGHQNLDYDKVIEFGMASYASSVNDRAVTKRAGSNPIVVKAVDVENHNVNPVVAVSDADAILIANQRDHFLDNCAVVFVR